MSLAAGTKLGPYEIQALLGAGGMGEVYRARDARLGRDVALKVVLESFAGQSERLNRFEQEARAVAALNHPNILAIHDIGEQNGAPYIVSELLEGESLRAALERGPLALRKTLDYGVQIAQGLAAAHEKGIERCDSDELAYGSRRGSGNGELYGAGAGAGRGRRRTDGYFCLWRGAVRNAFGRAGFSARDHGRNDDRGFEG